MEALFTLSLYLIIFIYLIGAYLVAQLVKNLSAVQETPVQFLSQEDPLEEEPTPVFLPGESPWTEEPGWLQSMGSQRHN